MNHKLIAKFAQVSAMASNASHSVAATQGACHNFTIEWISHMFADKGVVSDASATSRMQKLSARGGAGNGILQKVYGERWAEGAGSFRIADRMMISLRGLKEEALVIDYSQFNQADFVDKIKNPEYSGFIYSFWFNGGIVGAQGGAHTIGFFRSVQPKKGKIVAADEYVSAFDPNFGEFYFPAIEFNYWFNKLKFVYGGSLTYQMLKCVSKQ